MIAADAAITVALCGVHEMYTKCTGMYTKCTRNGENKHEIYTKVTK